MVDNGGVVQRIEVEPASRAAWRAWLAEHHDSSPGVWVIWRSKSAGPGGLSLDDAVLEALCFGWIDSTLRPLGGGRSALLFTPRRRGGTWSRRNRERVEQLIADGLMAPAGLRAVRAAQRDGSWTALVDAEELRIPDDLAAAFAAAPQARDNFAAFAPSRRRVALWWIMSAKRPETRARRVAETVRLAGENRGVNERPRPDR